MTDKQLIIDGVDVSGCEYYNKDDKTCREVNGNYDTDICEFDKCENYNCCYKQLKRKEQEVQQAMDNYVQLDLQRVKEYNELVDLYKAKEQECEELHSRTASIIYSLTGGRLSYSTYSLEGCEDAYRDQLSIDVERATKELQEENETLKQEVNTLEQALDEIEKQVKVMNNECFYDNICDCNNCDMRNGCSYYRKFKILAIINKAKEGNNDR